MPGSTTTSADETRRDELLAIRCQLGEAAAFDELVERWHRPLWLFARRMTADEEAAREATQDIWLRVLRAMPRLRDPARFRPWLFGIARRALIDRLRRQYARPELETLDVGSMAATDPAEPEPAERIDAMLDELQHLPVIERETLVLFYLDELTLAQVADALEVPAGTVKSRLFRARGMLRERMNRRTTEP